MSDAGSASTRSARPRPSPALTYASRVGLIALAGGLFRLAFLYRQPLWRDEAFTAVVVRRPLDDMLAAVAHDSAPPLHYLLEYVIAQAGDAPWLLRLVSALAGMALIPLVAALARRIRGDAAGVWAAAFVAVLPAAVVASRDARMYALDATLVVAAVLSLWRALERPTIGRWVAYVVVASAAIWTDYFAVFAVAAMLAGAWRLRPPRRTLAVAAIWSAAALASIAPWVLAAPEQFAHGQVPFWVEPLGVKTVGGTLVQLVSGPPIDPGIPFKLPLQALQVVAIFCGAAALLPLVRGWRRLGVRERQAASFCAVAGGAGVLLLALVSVWRPVLEARYASVLWPPLFALAGVGLALASRRAGAWLLVGLALPSLALSVAITHPETDRLVPAIEARLGPHDLIDAYPTQYLLLLREGDDALRGHLHVVSTDVPWFWGTAAYPPGAILSSVPADVRANGGRILRVAEPEDPTPVLPGGYRPVEQVCEVRVCLTVYDPAG